VPHDWQPTNAHDDREQVNKAREAAEALFASKKQVASTEASTSIALAPSQNEPPAPRIPRIIAMPSTMHVTRETAAPPTDPKPGPRRAVSRRPVPASQHVRVRTLVLYGMTLAEVADLYSVPMNVIERIVADGTDEHSSTIE